MKLSSGVTDLVTLKLEIILYKMSRRELDPNIPIPIQCVIHNLNGTIDVGVYFVRSSKVGQQIS
jgi:hypothetical protein